MSDELSSLRLHLLTACGESEELMRQVAALREALRQECLRQERPLPRSINALADTALAANAHDARTRDDERKQIALWFENQTRHEIPADPSCLAIEIRALKSGVKL